MFIIHTSNLILFEDMLLDVVVNDLLIAYNLVSIVRVNLHLYHIKQDIWKNR